MNEGYLTSKVHGVVWCTRARGSLPFAFPGFDLFSTTSLNFLHSQPNAGLLYVDLASRMFSQTSDSSIWKFSYPLESINTIPLLENTQVKSSSTVIWQEPRETITQLRSHSRLNNWTTEPLPWNCVISQSLLVR